MPAKSKKNYVTPTGSRAHLPVPAAPQSAVIESFVDPYNDRTLLQYFSAIRTTYGAVTFLGLGSVREKVTRGVHLDALFVQPRLTLQHLTAAEAARDKNESWTEKATTLLQAASMEQRLVVLGDPGSGKSTLVQYLAEGLCRTMDKSVPHALGGSLVPIPLILRELDLSRLRIQSDFPTLLQTWLDSTFSPAPNVFTSKDGRLFLEKLLVSGQAFVMLDGLDEIGDLELRQLLRAALWDGFDKYPRCRFLVTSRIIGYSAVPVEEALLPVDDAMKHRWIENGLRQGYTEDQLLYEMPQPVDSMPVAALRYVAPFSQRQIEEFSHKWMLAVGDPKPEAERNARAFITGISERQSTRELAPTPILLVFMGLVFRSSRDFPNGRAELYELIVKAYLETIEKEKFGTSAEFAPGINHAVLHRLLDRAGWEAQLMRANQAKVSEDKEDKKNSREDTERREVLIPESKLRTWFQETLSSAVDPDAIEPAIDRFLQYLAQRTGLLIPRGQQPVGVNGEMEEFYAFLHLSVQEFLAARWLMERMTDDDWIERERAAWRRKTPAAGSPPSPESLPSLRAYTHEAVWHEVFFLLHEIWPKPTPLLRLFASDPWISPASKTVRESLAEEIMPAKSNQIPPFDSARSQLTLLAAVAVDESNALAFHRPLRFALLQAAHARAQAQSRFYSTGQIMAVLSRPGSCLRLSWQALLTVAMATHELHLGGWGPIGDPNTAPALLKEIAGLKMLHTLNLGEAQVREPSVLAGLTHLQTLGLNGTQVTELSALAGMTELQSLDLAWTQVSELGSLAGFTTLRTLSLIGTQVSDLSPLAGLTSLESLFIGRTQVSDLRALAGLTSLRFLQLDKAQVSELGPLAELTSLEYLFLSAEQKNSASCRKLQQALPKLGSV